MQRNNFEHEREARAGPSCLTLTHPCIIALEPEVLGFWGFGALGFQDQRAISLEIHELRHANLFVATASYHYCRASRSVIGDRNRT